MIPTFNNFHWNIVHDTKTILLEHVLTFDPLQPSLQTFGSHLKFLTLEMGIKVQDLGLLPFDLMNNSHFQGGVFLFL